MSAGSVIDLLKRDHDKVRGLLSELVSTTNRAAKKRMDLLGKIRKEIQVHAALEEEIFYPAFKEADGAEHRKMFFEAKEEHRAVEDLILPDLADTDVESDAFHGRAKVLKELIEHHAEEEENDMFEKARKTFSDSELADMADRVLQRKKELESQL